MKTGSDSGLGNISKEIGARITTPCPCNTEKAIGLGQLPKIMLHRKDVNRHGRDSEAWQVM